MLKKSKFNLFVVSFLAASCLILYQSKFAALEFSNSNKMGKVYAVTIHNPFNESYELTNLKNELNNLASTKPKLKVGLFYINPNDGSYINLNAKDSFCAASLIKLPILVSLMQCIDKGSLSLNTPLEINSSVLTGGSGYLQWQPLGTKVSLEDTARLMITHSDNTATNMIIKAIGGKEKINFDFKVWGLQRTHIANMLGDFEGTNKTSPYDLAYLLGRIDKGELVSPRSKKLMLTWLKQTRVRTLLPNVIDPSHKIYHKTGDIKAMVGDAGIVENKDGSHTIIAIQVERPSNDLRANELIRTLAKVIYKND